MLLHSPLLTQLNLVRCKQDVPLSVQCCAMASAGPITLSSSNQSLTWSIGGASKSFLQKAINLAVCFTQIKFSIPGLNIGHQLLCRHAPCSSQYSRSCQAALKIKAGTLSSLQIILKNTITLLKPFVRNRTASSLPSGLREPKLKISGNEDFLFCFLRTSFLILIPTYLPSK